MKRGRPPHDDILTPAEWRVAELVRHGLSTSDVVRTLGISHDGARSLARAATATLGLSGREELRHRPGIRKRQCPAHGG